MLLPIRPRPIIPSCMLRVFVLEMEIIHCADYPVGRADGLAPQSFDVA